MSIHNLFNKELLWVNEDGIFDQRGVIASWDTLLLVQSKIHEIFAEYDRESLTRAIDETYETLRRESEARRLAERLKEKALRESETKIAKGGFVYLMQDTSLGYHKIGFSTNPQFRERTLQAQKPTIQLEHYWKGTWRIEQSLHEKFMPKRIRGEWFDLSSEDIAEIMSFFQTLEVNCEK